MNSAPGAMSVMSSTDEKTVKDAPAATAPLKEETHWTRRRIIFFTGLALLVSGVVAIVIALPIVLRRHHTGFDSSTLSDGGPVRPKSDPARPVMAVHDFPDPGLLEYNGTWYAFGTRQRHANNHVHVPIAVSKDFKNWTLLGEDGLPNVGAWELKQNHWAPDVIRREDGRFVMYYSGQNKTWKGHVNTAGHHCIGVAVSNGTSPLGPYTPEDEPLACPSEYGGAIDSAPFKDVDGKVYVTYKADGNSVGHGGDCNNGKFPLVNTPIMLQEMESDGITKVGGPVEILGITSSDGPLVEAPRVIRTDQGIYYLTFSSHCFSSPKYNVKYATATSVKGPYQRASIALLKTGDYDLISPGGASISSDGTKMVFHANCGLYRCMYAAGLHLNLTSVDFITL